MLPSSFKEFGIIKKPFGGDGTLRCVIYDEFLGHVHAGNFIFIMHDGIFVPYLVEKLDTNKHSYIKLEDIDDSAKGEKYKSQKIFIPDDNTLEVDSSNDSTMKYLDLEGFTAYITSDVNGKIERIESYPEQEMAIINLADKLHLVPLNESFIRKIEYENKIVWFDLPEGLLEL